jgi:hypothetical protein
MSKSSSTYPDGRGNDGLMESKHRFPQALENACAFPTFPPPRLLLSFYQNKNGKIVVRERGKYLTAITRRSTRFASIVTWVSAADRSRR